MKRYSIFLLCLIVGTSTPFVRLSDQDIVNLYTKFVKPYQNNENKFRYVPLPMERNNLSWTWENRDFPRVIALLEFDRFVKEHNITAQKGLAINGMEDPEWFYLSVKSRKSISYDDDKQYDLHQLQLNENDFDFVMVNQTLEHVYDPVRCLENIHKHMAPNGILYFNVPANSIPHTTPFHHFTGFTPVGAGAVVQAAGFEILHIGQWGNLTFLNKMFTDYTFLDYRSIEQPGLNQFEYPIIVWVFAKKIA